MNALPPLERHALHIVDLVDFKWLMAHEGHAVHVDRLQHDPAYATEQLALADASPTGALRHVAQRLRGALLAAPG
ncbi:MAG: hypothetical protein ABI696_02100 [Rubrivivax sp.]